MTTLLKPKLRGLLRFGTSPFLSSKKIACIASLLLFTVSLSRAQVNPQHATSINGIAYFSAENPENGRELWRSDGTPSGTYLVKDLKPGSASSIPENLTNVNGTLYFICNSSFKQEGPYAFTRGYEIWKSDGTNAGTIKIDETSFFRYMEEPGAFSSLFFGIGNIVYYTIPGTSWNEYYLMKSNGTEAGTVVLRNFFDDQYNPFFTNVNGTLYFAAKGKSNSDGLNENGLWKTDGTTAGTVLVKEYQHPFSSQVAISNLTVANGTLFFSAYSDTGNELWKSDGTTTGTVLVKNIRTGTGVGMDSSNPEHLVSVNNVLYFAADDGINGTELWKSDGTQQVQY